MSANLPQPLAARLTPAGRGAVATIQVSFAPAKPGGIGGDSSCLVAIDPLFQAANGLPLSQQSLQKIVFGRWGETDCEDLVVCRTAADLLEIHCHGGEAAVQRVLDDLSIAGCRVVDWREQNAIAESLFVAECSSGLCQASTWRTTKLLLEQANGLLRGAFEQIIVASASRQAGSGIDNSRESIQRPAANSGRMDKGGARHQGDHGGRRIVDEMLSWAVFGLHLTMPWSVVLTGRPNVGKSSLINALLGYQRAIVFDQPGTTRDVVTGETAFDGWPVVLADTAGIRETVEELEVAGIALAQARLNSADLRIVLVDVSDAPSEDDFRLLREWPDAMVVAHKSDLANRWCQWLPEHAIAVSSITGAGLSELQRQIVCRLVPSVPRRGTPIPITARQVSLLREIQSATTDQSRYDAARRLLD